MQRGCRESRPRLYDKRSYGMYRTENRLCLPHSDMLCPPETDKACFLSAPIHTALLIIQPGLHFSTLHFQESRACCQPRESIRQIPVKPMHRRIPAEVGRRAASTVQRRLLVSLWMVRRVVEQGQWNRENRIMLTAV